MRVLIVSDTHGTCEDLRTVLDKAGAVDQVIHCGDVCGDEELIRSMCPCPCAMVSGNNDYFAKLPRTLILELGGHRIYVTHGHMQHVYYGSEQLYYYAKQEQCDIVLYGHTHIPSVTEEDGIWFANPGSLTYPRQTGRKKTYLLLQLAEDGGVEFQLRTL